MVNPGNKMTGLEIGLLIGLVVAVFGGGVATGVAIQPDNSEEAVLAAMEPYVKELDNVKTLIDPERTPFCNEKSDKYDDFKCVMIELCDSAEGTDVEVTADCKAFANVIVTEEIVSLAAEYADSNWRKYGDKNGDLPDGEVDGVAWQKAKDDFNRQWEKRKGG